MKLIKILLVLCLIFYHAACKEMDNSPKRITKPEIEKLTASAKDGNAKAQYALGVYYVKIDSKQSVEYWSKAAIQGYVKAQNNLMWCYQNCMLQHCLPSSWTRCWRRHRLRKR